MLIIKPMTGVLVSFGTVACRSVICILAIRNLVLPGSACSLTEPLFKCTGAPIDQRADDLLGRLTQTQIIQQTWSHQGFEVKELLSKIGSNGVGQVTWKTLPGDSVVDRVVARNELQKRVVQMSGIPISFNSEALHAALPGGTVFPELSTQGATWDVALVQEIFSAIAEEARACGIDTAFSPVLNMWVDARFGRLQEGFSENPTLSAAYAVASVAGLQGAQPAGHWAYFDAPKLVALGKHYAAYGAAEGGLNGAPAELSERTLREWYLAPWRAFAQAGGKGVMASHNTVLNQPMHANDYVTNGILRREFGFGDGIVLSDCNDVPALVDFRTAANISHAAAMAIAGGVDLDLQCGPKSAYTQLATALKDRSIDFARVKQAARRVLMAKFALGLFDEVSGPDPATVAAKINTKKHQSLALRAAEEGIVLLVNKGGLLPLDPKRNMQIAVVGELGHCVGKIATDCTARTALLGSYTDYDGSVHVPTVAEALTSAIGSQARVEWSFGASVAGQSPADAAASRASAVALAKTSDVVVAVLGDDLATANEWGDRDSLDLPGDQLALLAALCEGPAPVVVVLVTGRTATFGPGNSILANVSALFSAFRPGQMGGAAISNLLLGVTNPSGRLVQNWVRNSGQAMSGASPWLQWRVGKWVSNKRSPPDPDGRRYDSYHDGPSDPLFHFGQGLSYTTFAMGNLSVVTAAGGLEVSVDVTNTGGMLGTEVVQVYVVDPVMSYVRPWKRLLAFGRVTLEPGGQQRVRIPVSATQLAFQDDSSTVGTWRVVPGEYTVRVGPSSVEDLLVAQIRLDASSLQVRPAAKEILV